MADATPACDPDGDDDGDGISNGAEGCLEGRNTDGDLLEDWLDEDSDNDGCPDALEDLDGDGQVGDCRTECPNLDPAECGPGQACLATRLCDPPVAHECAGEESDPLVPDTYEHGDFICGPSTSICEPQSPETPTGRPPVQTHTGLQGKLQIAVWPEAVVADQTLINLGPEDCANGADDDGDGATDCADDECQTTSLCGAESITFDLTDPNASAYLAGFALTRSTDGTSLEQARDDLLAALRQRFSDTNVVVRSAGHPTQVLDGVEAVVELTVAVTVSPLSTVSEVRDELVQTLLGRLPGEVSNLPGSFGLAATEFVVSLSIQRRTPSVGAPYLAVMGAAMNLAFYDTPTSGNVLLLADAANGSGLAAPGFTLGVECEELQGYSSPLVVDMIWVIDGSFSAQPVRATLSTAAPALYAQAINAGMDFRMGVVDMESANNGVFCTDQGQSNDFFLTPASLSQFEHCVLEPWGSLDPGSGAPYGITQGYNAIVNHLPRALAPNRIRPNAALIVIYVSDEAAQEVRDSCGASPPWDTSCVRAEVQPTLDLLSGVSDPEAHGTAHAMVGPPPGGCSQADLGGGYIELATNLGGQIASVCGADFETFMGYVLDDVAAVGGVVLAHRPVSSTLTVARNGVFVPRSLVDGFRYYAGMNSLLFTLLEYQYVPGDLVIGYERWVAP